ncbi:MAG: glycosyltransferase [Clostridium sp.]|nr:glycosyltransferase [Clostridium sp.]
MNVIGKIREWNRRRLGRRDQKKRLAASVFVSEVDSAAPYVLISYIPYALYLTDETALLGHQNMREQRVMVDVLNEMGYNVYVSDYRNDTLPEGLNCCAVFGIAPLFEKAATAYPHALKIYYGCTAYWQHQERMTRKRVDAFNARYGLRVAYQRMPVPTQAEEMADRILQIGSRITIETYPGHLRSKITLIHQSTTVDNICVEAPNSQRRDFIWFGSGGSILKGADLLIDYFLTRPDLTLHVVGGPLEKDVLSVYTGRLTPNIRLYGWMDVKSEAFREIVERSAFTIYPSCSEGGCPGGVLSMMKLGVIPIVSRYAAFDGIECYGFTLDELTLDAVARGVEWAESLSDEERDSRSRAGARYVADTYNLSVYEREFRQYFQSVLPPVKL